MKDEVEVVRYPDVSQINLFVVEIKYRNPHFHRDFELNMIFSGSGTITIHGQTHPLSAGDMILINPDEVHEIKADNEPVTILCLQINPKFLRRAFPNMGHLSFDIFNLALALTEKQHHELKVLLIELAYQYTERKPMWEYICGSLLDLLACFLLRKIPLHQLTDEQRRSNKKRTYRLSHIVSWVEENYMHKLLLSDFAEKEGLSMGYLSHFIQENLHQSFQEYVSIVRLNHAKTLLQGDSRLIDVSMECGFSDPRYMAKAFLKYEGCSPEQFRQRSREEKVDINSHSEKALQSERFLPGDTVRQLLAPHREPMGSFLDEMLEFDKYSR